jgi:hypothetical protein
MSKGTAAIAAWSRARAHRKIVGLADPCPAWIAACIRVFACRTDEGRAKFPITLAAWFTRLPPEQMSEDSHPAEFQPRAARPRPIER